MSDDATRSTIPANSVVLGYGPMLPLAAAGIAAWLMPDPWPFFAMQLGLIWGAMILIFIAGVRRGYGFGRSGASTRAEIAAAILYFVLGGLALVAGRTDVGLPVLILGYAAAALLDRHAALAGDAPAFFATLRPPAADRHRRAGAAMGLGGDPPAGGLAPADAWFVGRLTIKPPPPSASARLPIRR